MTLSQSELRTLAVIADAAHMTCIEQPERFNRTLRIFLDSTVGATSAPNP